MSENTTAITMLDNDGAAEISDCEKYSIIFTPPVPRSIPVIIPSTPPIRHKTTASTINCVPIELFEAPSAFLVPISLVHSVIDTSIIFITPIPPTRRDIAAIPANTAFTELRSVVNSSNIEDIENAVGWKYLLL